VGVQDYVFDFDVSVTDFLLVAVIKRLQQLSNYVGGVEFRQMLTLRQLFE
jgi:hypothetical protein